MPRVMFSNRSFFYSALKKNINEYFLEKKIKKTGNWKLYLKSVVLIILAVSQYVSLMVFKFPTGAGIILCSLLGFTLAGVGFNIMHDACHGSYSDKKWVNHLLGLSLNALGGNAFIWRYKHSTHHTYTNVDGMDDDIAKSPLLRQCESQKWLPFHKYQHIYIMFFYAISSIVWITVFDFNKYLKQRASVNYFKMKISDHLIFWISKFFYIFFYLVIPIYFVGYKSWIIGFIVMHVTMGYTLALVFQLAHVVEDTNFISCSDNSGALKIDEWAIHQLSATSNFSYRNSFLNWYLGGLNYQIEHHLFPGISHIHYPAISFVVKRTCEEFNLPYHNFPSMSRAIWSHYSQIKRLGKKPL